MDSRIPIYSEEWLLFTMLCETGSLKQTADMFSISISTASRTLKKLEDDLGITLFDRSVKPMELTQEGRTLLKELTPAMKEAGRVIHRLKMDTYQRPELRIGFLDSFSYSLVPYFLSSISNRVSRITCLTGSSDRLIERLRAHELDVIMSSDPIDSESYWKKLLMIQERSVLVLPKDINIRQQETVTWGQLSLCNLPFIGSYNKSGRGKLIEAFINTHNIPITGITTVDNGSVKLKLVSLNKGWTITSPLALLNHQDLLASLQVLPLPSPGVSRKVYLIGATNIDQDFFNLIYDTFRSSVKEHLLPKLDLIADWVKDGFEFKNRQ